MGGVGGNGSGWDGMGWVDWWVGGWKDLTEGSGGLWVKGRWVFGVVSGLEPIVISRIHAPTRSTLNYRAAF